MEACPVYLREPTHTEPIKKSPAIKRQDKLVRMKVKSKRMKHSKRKKEKRKTKERKRKKIKNSN